MEAFEKIIEVRVNDLDDLNHVNNVRYVQWIQDISKEHWESKVSEELLGAVVWVVLNHNITYRNAARLGDVIRLKTYISQTKGATSTRVVEMYNRTKNQLLVHSKTDWCLLNAKTLRPMRISKEISTIFEDKTA